MFLEQAVVKLGGCQKDACKSEEYFRTRLDGNCWTGLSLSFLSTLGDAKTKRRRHHPAGDGRPVLGSPDSRRLGRCIDMADSTCWKPPQRTP
mmetsp:Transcript_44351/g.61669  ORF Transcript_44351/g.61669 Transcript_44351/m.61669 type:complete len:92 (+) Transcript_44351:102-377(+)